MKIRELFVKEVVAVNPRDTMARAAELMEQQNVGAVVVVEQERPVGILTDRDIALAICVRGISRDECVQEVMTCPVETMDQSEGIFDATRHMMEMGVRRLPVVDKVGRLVGLVTLDDLLLLVTRELRQMAAGVRAEIRSAGVAEAVPPAKG